MLLRRRSGGVGLRLIDAVEGAGAGRAPLGLGHVRASIPKSHACLQRIAAAARCAGRNSLGLAVEVVDEEPEVVEEDVELDVVVFTPDEPPLEVDKCGGRWRERCDSGCLGCGRSNGRRWQRGCSDSRALGDTDCCCGGGRRRLGLGRRLLAGLFTAWRRREGRQGTGCQRARRCSSHCGRPCRCMPSPPRASAA